MHVVGLQCVTQSSFELGIKNRPGCKGYIFIKSHILAFDVIVLLCVIMKNKQYLKHISQFLFNCLIKEPPYWRKGGEIYCKTGNLVNASYLVGQTWKIRNDIISQTLVGNDMHENKMH